MRSHERSRHLSLEVWSGGYWTSSLCGGKLGVSDLSMDMGLILDRLPAVMGFIDVFLWASAKWRSQVRESTNLWILGSLGRSFLRTCQKETMGK